MIRRFRVLVCGVMMMAIAGISLGMGAPEDSRLVTPELAFERGGVGLQQGTQVLNQATGRIESLFGMADGPYQFPPENAALAYLAKQQEVTGYAPEELTVVRTVESQGSNFVTLEAMVGGLPVYPGETVVTFDRQQRVVFLFNGLLPVNRFATTQMTISKDRAIQIARDHLKPSGELGGPFVRAVLWAGSLPARPAWKITIPAQHPRGDWELLIDGNSGEVFRVRNNEKCYNGHGMAFDPDPLTTANATYGSTGYTDNSDADTPQLTAQRFAVTLPDITYSSSLYRLQGPWVTLADNESPSGAPVTSSDSNGFSFTRNAQGFEDVMCYYHIDKSQRWIQSLGFTNIQHAPLSCDPHGLSGDDNSHYVPSTNQIAFGEGGVDDAEEADVIWHEYGHGIQNSEVPGYGSSHDEGSMGEGFGDYWAGSYSQTISNFNNTWVFNWDGHNEWWAGRVLNAGLNYSSSGSSEIHTAGQIWSQACYDTRNRPAVGRTVMDKVVLQHHFGLGTTATMPTAAAAILTADNTLYGGIHAPDIYAGFVPRGLLSSSGAISCLSPNGGESWNAGSSHTITWSYYNLTGNVRIELNRTYPSGTWELINNTTALSAGSYSWTVTGAASTTARIRVSSQTTQTINDVSNANFTIVSSGPSLYVSAPNGGESWVIGDANNITWTSANLSENVKIELNRAYPGTTWETIVASTSNTGTYAWTVTGAATTAARVRITGVTTTTCGDTSDANFSIGTRSVAVTAPNGGQSWIVGDANNITWTSANLSENVKIELNRAYPGSTWETIIASTANTGTYAWTVTGAATAAARVRITGVTHTAIGDTSDANFTIGLRTITVAVPNGGETWVIGDANNVTWTSSNITENVKIELNRAYPGTTWETIVASTGNTGTYAWTLTGAATTAARIRITGVTHTTIGDSSNGNFTMALRTLTVTAPNGGETWMIGDVNNVTWTSANLSENVKIELNRAYPGSTWETVNASVANTGSYAWTVTGAATAAARIRITGVTHTTIGDSSNAVFTIGTRALTLTLPNGGETWLVGDVNNITWSSSGLSENVKLELNRSYPGSTWETINASTTNSGTYAWTVTSPLTTTARVRITGVTHPAVGDSSNGNFTIGQRTLAVTSPNGGENWAVGNPQSILWTSQNLTGNVNVELNRNYPSGGWESLAANITNSGSLAWTPDLPVSSAARVRVTGVSYPTVTDVSDNNFILYVQNTPPQISHDALHDQQPASFTVTAKVTDDAPGFVTRMLFWPAVGGSADSVLLSASGNPNEFAATAGPLAENRYVYFVRAIDAGGLSARSDTGYFEVRTNCGAEQAYDDGVAEVSSWSDSAGFKWAVRFDALASPYLLCGAQIGVSAVHPDSAHSPISVFIYLADGIGGLPGTLVWSKTAGSIGNVIGGVPENPDHWTWVATRDGSGNPLQLTSAFYVAVANPFGGHYEAFLSDTSSARAGRSFVYDPCDSTWHNELDATETTQAGNRMIRVSGLGLTPPTVVISTVDTGLKLTWTRTGAPVYHVYKSNTPSGVLTFVAATSDTTLTDPNTSDAARFYTVVSATP